MTFEGTLIRAYFLGIYFSISNLEEYPYLNDFSSEIKSCNITSCLL